MRCFCHCRGKLLAEMAPCGGCAVSNRWQLTPLMPNELVPAFCKCDQSSKIKDKFQLQKTTRERHEIWEIDTTVPRRAPKHLH